MNHVNCSLAGLLLASILVTGCGSSGSDSVADDAGGTTTTTTSTVFTNSSVTLPGPDSVVLGRWDAVRRFAIQLTDIDPAVVAASNTDMVIVDTTRNGSAAGTFSTADVTTMRSGGNRKVVAYLSIGEAEDYRSYWQSGWTVGSPSFIGPRNANFPDNYQVRFWQPEWKSILYGNSGALVDQALAAGYDGLFLDVVDAWEFWQDNGRPTARIEMASLVKEIEDYARSHGGGNGFGVFLNGGEGLLDDATLLNGTTGYAREGVFFGQNGLNTQTATSYTQQKQQQLQLAVNLRRLVLSIDYTTSATDAATARSRAASAGYLEYVATSTALNTLAPQP